MSENPFVSPEAAPKVDRPPLRIRVPAGLLVVLWGLPVILAALAPDSMLQFFFGRLILPVLCLLVLTGWWMFAKSIPLAHRVAVFAAFLIAVGVTRLSLHKSMNEMSLMMYGAPAAVTVWCLWLIIAARLSPPVRTAGLMVLNSATWLAFCLFRVHGVTGSFAAEFDWRWNPSSEERLIASGNQTPAAPVSAASGNTTSPDSSAVTVSLQPGDWPEFRGTNRDSQIAAVSIRTDWSQSAPKEIWRKPVGPAWSSFAVVDGRLYSQEQLAAEERVVCRDAATGDTLWIHSETTRFEEPVAGAGPRATPTFAGGWIYAQGANGGLVCLDAATGGVKWSRDIAKDTGSSVPQWGFSASPLIHNGLVSVFGGAKGKAVVTLNAETGEPVWTGGDGSLSYCSAQISKIGDSEQLLISTDAGVLAFEPVGGKLLWQHEWPTEGVARVVQPCVLENGDVLIGTGLGVGLRRIHVEQKEGVWSTKELWTTTRCKPYFNDFVIHENHLYGFDGAVFMCVELEKGEVVWRARGYGSGQVLLLKDQALLIILSETGDVCAVSASPSKHEELGRFRALEGKTWNHPVLAHGKLYVRNSSEAACFELVAEEVPAETISR